ncbi:hypothetical protein CHS0354_041892 [Potamilus streckersoni]|uniref:Glycosyltransferase n=1 Tax=Potamilus streckersoni TaxID=2493646 RepID=A0AAE0STU8_9BIVA|nr:hypothetical protein CHS0354_041892 [Potamilus streckersoni]
MTGIIALKRRTNILKRTVFFWVVILVFCYGTLILIWILQKQGEKVFVHTQHNSIAIDSYSSSKKTAYYFVNEMVLERIKINMHGILPPDENSTEAFPTKGPFRIEAIIHQIWIDKNVPEYFRTYVSSLKENHLNYVYMFWTDEMAKKFVEVKFPIMLPFYVNYPRNLQRADAVRYMILYEYGGVYADLDIVSLRPLDPIMRKYTCILSQEPHLHPIYYSNFYGSACNAFMACRRHHPFMKNLVDNLPSFSVAGETVDSTGPRFVTILYRNFIADHPHLTRTDNEGVYLAPPEYFMPSSDHRLKNKMTNLCYMKVLTPLYKWACERFKMHGMGSPTNYTFTDHKWAHINWLAEVKRKSFIITDIVPDAKFYIQDTCDQKDTIVTKTPGS